MAALETMDKIISADWKDGLLTEEIAGYLTKESYELPSFLDGRDSGPFR